MSKSASENPGQTKTGPKKKAKRLDPAVPVNKTLEIRKVARQMVSAGNPPRPIEIVARLKAIGITVTSNQVSTALANTDFAFRRNRSDWERSPVLFPDPTLALAQVSIEDVIKAKAWVADVGSVEKAMAALVALKQFGGEATRKGDRDNSTGPEPTENPAAPSHKST